MRRGFLFCILILGGSIVATIPEASAQTPPGAQLSGHTREANGNPLADVALTLRPLPGGAPVRTNFTDRAGAFRFAGLSAGRYLLRAERLGFLAHEEELSLEADEQLTLEITLATQPILLEGITAAGRQETDRERARFETEPGVTARVVEAALLKSIPGLAEADVLRAVQLLPGVIATSDFSSSYNVRGGSTDQNLILIDGFTLFNPFHLGGLFSAFNSDAVERAELFSGGFGAEFGGRVSSVLQVESRSAVPDAVEVVGGISMLASRALLRAPLRGRIGQALGGQAGSVTLSARRSYFDQLLRPIAEFPYHLTDLQGHATLETRHGGQLALTTYWGEDVLDLSNFGADRPEEDRYEVLRLRWRWGNQLAGIRWLQPLQSGWIVNAQLGASAFVERLGFADFGDMRFGSRIDQLVGRGDLSRDLAPTLSTRLGVQVERMSYHNLAEAGGTTFMDRQGAGVLGAGYGSVRWQPTARWIIEPGVRLDLWHAAHATRQELSPRFAAKYFFGARQNTAVKFAAGRYTQFLHSLRDEQLPISNETWVLADAAVPPVTSNQVQVGVESFFTEGWSASAELYARTFSGVTEFNDADDPNDPDDDLLIGRGDAHGIDLQLRKSEGRVTGWMALSWLRAEREFPDPLTEQWPELPQTIRYAPIFDRRINLDIVANFTRGPLEFGVHWNYGSGLPYTRPIAQHLAWRQNPFTGRPELVGDDGGDLPLNVVLGPRNAERYPAYHRLDLNVRRTIERPWGTLIPYLQFVNLYDQRNVLFYFYDYGKAPPVRSGFSMFPFLPALGIEVAF